MRRALSSESGFLEFFDRGLGLLGSFPSLRDQGSGVTEEWMGILGFVEGGFGEGRSGVVVRRKEDLRASISSLVLVRVLVVCLVRDSAGKFKLSRESLAGSKESHGDSEEVAQFPVLRSKKHFTYPLIS
jgi:hypothetical protein